MIYLHQFIKDHTPIVYRKVRAIPRLSIGMAIMAGIVVGILLDINGRPIEYVRDSVVETAHAEEPKEVQIRVEINWTPERIDQEIETVAKKYKVSSWLMKALIDCESKGSTTVQSYHYNNGVRENSWGLSQIHLSAHTHITKEEALDPTYAIDFMGKHLSKGREEMWFNCYNKVTK